MSRFPRLSGLEIVKVLVKEFGFEVTRHRGSHVSLRKFVSERKVVTIVPLHKEVKLGTPFGILDLGGINRDEFLKKVI